MYLNDRMPLVQQIGEELYTRKFIDTASDDAPAFYRSADYSVLFSCNKEELENKGIELPKKASECDGFLKRKRQAAPIA